MRPYPRLTDAAKARVLQELAQVFALNNLRPAKAAETGSGTSLASDTPMMGVAVPLDPMPIQPALAGLGQERIQPPRTSERLNV
jgi:hypothetical protein